MSETTANPIASALQSADSVWIVRFRVLLSAALCWAGLHYLALGPFRSGAHLEPVLLTGGSMPLISVLLAVLVVAATGWLVRLLGARAGSLESIVAIGVGMALTALPGGTTDHFLTSLLIRPDSPPAPAYWRLCAEYAAMVVVCGLLVQIGGFRPNVAKNSAAQSSAALQLGALLLTAAVAAVGLMVLSGPRVGETYRGQVFFAVYASFAAGAYAAGSATKVRTPLAYLLAPVLLGVVGAVHAAIAGRLPSGYEHLNNIPVSAMVRGLPIETVAMGWLGVSSVLAARRAGGPPSR
ncbi:MAG: hypothetical protein IPM64_11905 [Phycisphaerales bacterium]|nr:hypothetical protein [Phycisphaerales bacterium]